MPRSTQTKLSNMCNGLHNLSNTVDVDGGEYGRDDDCYEMDLYRANYLFMKQSPMYSRLDQKYKEAKKKIRDQQKMIDLLNRQNIEIMERYSTRMNSVPPYIEQTVTLSETFAKIKQEPVSNNKPVTVVDLTNNDIMQVEPPVHIVIEDEDEMNEPDVEGQLVEQEQEEVVDEEEEVEVEETEEQEEVVDEEEEVEVVVEEEVEVEETEDEEEEVELVEETEEEEVVVEEEEETEEQEEEEVVVEEEEVEVDETEEEVEVDETEEEVEVDEEAEETEEQEEEEEGVYEVEIKGKRYYTTNDVNGTIYAVLDDDDIGDEVGKFVDGKALFAK